MQRPQLLAVRVLPCHALEIHSHGRVFAECEPSAELGLDRGKAELIEARRLRLQRRLIGKVLERLPAPHRERRVELGDRGVGRQRRAAHVPR